VTTRNYKVRDLPPGNSWIYAAVNAPAQTFDAIAEQVRRISPDAFLFTINITIEVAVPCALQDPPHAQA
jgi:hypothetical protein